MKKSLIITIWLTLSFAHGQAAIYYVAPSGKNFNSGSQNKPFQTLQYAINRANGKDPNNLDTIVVKSGTYIVDPIEIRDKKYINILFDENVEMVARPLEKMPGFQGNWVGSFKNPYYCLIKIQDSRNISLCGTNTILRMQKQQYIKLPKELIKEFRHVIAVYNGRDIKISSFVLRDSGGDGIEISGSSRKNDENVYSKNIQIENITCDNNFRNGISIISVDGLSINNCVIKNTNGTRPEAGICIEPFLPFQKLKNIKFSNISLSNNKQRAIIIQPDWLRGKQGPSQADPIDILFENVRIEKDNGIYLARFGDNSPKTQITFKELFMNNTKWGIWLGLSSKQCDITFENCTLQNIDNKYWPVSIFGNESYTSNPGGINFTRFQIFDDKKRPAVKYTGKKNKKIYNITGQIYVKNDNWDKEPFDVSGASLENVRLEVYRGIGDFIQMENR